MQATLRAVQIERMSGLEKAEKRGTGMRGAGEMDGVLSAEHLKDLLGALVVGGPKNGGFAEGFWCALV